MKSCFNMILALFSFGLLAQEKPILFFTTNYQKNDIFVQGEMAYSIYSDFSGRSGLGIGLNRTLIQQRFFPQIAQAFQWHLMNETSRFQWGPEIVFKGNSYRLSSQTRITYASGAIGYSLQYGKQLRFFQGAHVGKELAMYSSGNRFSYWMFSIAIGLAYAL